MRYAYSIAFLLTFFFSCTQNNEQHQISDEVVLARIGPEVITIQDFIRRAEYAIRPDYCRQDNYIHKKIVLNSLIGEKLTALEQEKQAPENSDDSLDSYFKGRKEQAMRQLFYAKEFHSKVTILDQEANKAFKLAGRRVSMQFLNLPDIEMVDKIKQLDSSGVLLDSIYQVLWGGEAPSREMTWFDRENQELHDAVFSQNIEKGQMLGPFRTDDDTFMLLKIISWTDKIEITEFDRELLWRDVQERLKEKKAKKEYLSWVSGLMQGKEMNLNSDAFYDYAEKASEYFFKMDSIKKNMLNQALWDDVDFETNTFNVDNVVDKDATILNYDGDSWTVEDLNNQLLFHPLVFRKRKMSRSEFPEQLRLAIADLIRDMEITKQCYAAGYDDHWSIELNTAMWRASLNSKQYLSRLRSKNKQISNQEQWLAFMNSKIDSLQEAYSNDIEINMDVFEQIKLTSTDMMVIQRGVPYPILVPSFPILTSDNKLDYGRSIIK